MWVALDRAHEAKLAAYRALADATVHPCTVGASLVGWKPVVSDALACHPDEIPEAMARDRQHGITTEYLPDGRAVLSSRSHRKAMMKSLGMHDNEGGYGDG